MTPLIGSVAPERHEFGGDVERDHAPEAHGALDEERARRVERMTLRRLSGPVSGLVGLSRVHLSFSIDRGRPHGTVVARRASVDRPAQTTPGSVWPAGTDPRKLMRLQEIEAAIRQLPASDLARLTAWLDAYNAAAWDAQIEADLEAGRLDALLDEVDREYEAGRATPL